MKEYFYFSLYCSLVGLVVLIFKAILACLFDIIYCYFNFKGNNDSVRALYKRLLSVDDRSHPFLDCIVVITLGALYLVGNYIFMNGVIRITPLFFMLASNYLSCKSMPYVKRFSKIFASIFICAIAIPSILISKIVKKITKYE